MAALLNAGWLVFVVGDKNYETGLLKHFPSAYGMSGFAGFGVSTGYEAAVNNGFGRAWRLPVEREIPPLTRFGVDVKFEYALVPTRAFVLRVLLEGIMWRPVQ